MMINHSNTIMHEKVSSFCALTTGATCNASAQCEARTDWSVSLNQTELPSKPGKQTYIGHSKE